MRNRGRDLLAPEVQAAEARTLRNLYDEIIGEPGSPGFKSQASFGTEFDIGTQGMVWQYLDGRRPLNLAVAISFARGLNIPVRAFSPRLAQQAALAASLNTFEPGTPETARMFANQYAGLGPEAQKSLQALYTILSDKAVSNEDVESRMPVTAPKKPKKGEK